MPTLTHGPDFVLEDAEIATAGHISPPPYWKVPIVEGGNAAFDQLGRVTGVDLDFEGDLLVGSSGDLVLTHGLDGVKKSIARALVTSPGEFPLEPTYGIGADDFLGLPARVIHLEELKERVRRSILAHPLVEALGPLLLTKTESLIVVTAEIRTASQTETLSVQIREV